MTALVCFQTAAVLAFLAPSATLVPTPVLSKSLRPICAGRTERGARLALLPDAPPPELPTAALLKAIARCGSSATAADVAAEAGLEIEEARRQLLSLARLVGAELQVSEQGELLFVFEEAGVLRGQLRRQSVRQRARDAWTAASPPLFWMMRATFGLGLLASLTLVTVAITTLAASKDGERSSSSSSLSSVGSVWGASPLDFLYYSSRPYGYYGYASEEKGFLQSCFSLLFGDGDPNADLARRQSAAAAALIRANGGAVTAEQLAPLLNPSLPPEQYADESLRAGAPLREDWVLPLLLQFNGEPVVTESGDLIYRFPELMETAAVEAGEGAWPRLGGAADADADAATSVRAALAYPESPPGWRPRVGDVVRVARVVPSRARRDGGAAAGLAVGREALVVSDDRDALPFGLFILPPAGRGRSRMLSGAELPPPNAYFSLRELVPVGGVRLEGGVDVGADGGPLALAELPQPFSTAPTSQLVMAGTLGAANLAGVLYVGRLLASVSGVPTAYMGSAGPMIGLLRRIYVPLLAYATGFVAVPAVRAVRRRRTNAQIAARNRRRVDWARAVSGSEGPLVEATAIAAAVDDDGDEGDAAYSPEDRRGLRQALRSKLQQKLRAARALAPSLRRFRRGTADSTTGSTPGASSATFSTARSLDENAAAAGEGGLSEGFDDFDRRLGLTPDDSDGSPPRV